VPGGRRLIVVRRDQVEHLLMIGGPTDVVIEPNIVPAAAASRRDWATQTEPARVTRTPRTPAAEELPAWPVESLLSPAVPPPRRQPRAVDPLAGLAAEIGRTAEPRAPMLEEAPSGIIPRAPRTREPTREREVQIERELVRYAAACRNFAEVTQRLDAARGRPAKAADARSGEALHTVAANAEAAPPVLGAAPAEQPRLRTSPFDSLKKKMASLLGPRQAPDDRPPDAEQQ
jgi:hypothetical protein